MVVYEKRGFIRSLYLSSGGRTRTYDLWVMSPTSYHCSTPRCFNNAKLLLFFYSAKFFKKKISNPVIFLKSLGNSFPGKIFFHMQGFNYKVYIVTSDIKVKKETVFKQSLFC